jgi:YHS domain-containing protein
MFKKITFSALLLVGFQAFAIDEHNVAPGLTAAGAPLGLQGVDPVAFVEIGNRIDGSATNTSTHDGVAYYFASAANKETFDKHPVRYTPQNGGFCTFGVSVGKKFDGDPRFAAVEDGLLYVFLSEEIYRAFDKDRSGTINKAAVNWKRIQHTDASSL